MTPPSPESLQKWTIVTRRRVRRRQGKTIPTFTSGPKTLTLTSESEIPSSWIPTDSSTDPEREFKLLHRMQSSILWLDNSRFVCRFLSRLRSHQIQDSFNKLFDLGSQIEIVAYGIGSIESYEVPRLQLALALLLKKELGARAPGPIQVFDPILSAAECSVLSELGCRVLSVDEGGRRKTAVPTIFYMPHCEAVLYDNLLNENWNPSALRRMAVLGNSFGVYERYVREARGLCGSVAIEVDGRHMLAVRKYVLEVEMEEREKDQGFKEEEDDITVFYKAFHDISWHFFEFDEDADLKFLCN